MKKVLVAFMGLGALGIAAILLLQSAANHKSAILNAFQSDFDSGNLDAMVARADGVLAGSQDDIDALLAAATAYAMKGSVGFSERENGSKAIEYADRVLRISPDNSEAFRVKGYALEIQERYDEAHANYDKAIANDPRNFQALSNKGHAYDLQGNLGEAEKFYQRSLEVNPNGDHALLNISRLYIRQKRLPEAKRSLETLGENSRNNRFRAEAYQNLAELLRAEMNYKEAKAAIDKAIELDPSVPQAWVTRGRVRMMAFIEEEEATHAAIEGDIRQSAEKATALNPNAAAAYTLLYDLYTGKGDAEKRAIYKQKALEAIDKDITLGQEERKALRSYLESEISVVQESDGGASN